MVPRFPAHFFVKKSGKIIKNRFFKPRENPENVRESPGKLQEKSMYSFGEVREVSHGAGETTIPGTCGSVWECVNNPRRLPSSCLEHAVGSGSRAPDGALDSQLPGCRRLTRGTRAPPSHSRFPLEIPEFPAFFIVKIDLFILKITGKKTRNFRMYNSKKN